MQTSDYSFALKVQILLLVAVVVLYLSSFWGPDGFILLPLITQAILGVGQLLHSGYHGFFFASKPHGRYALASLLYTAGLALAFPINHQVLGIVLFVVLPLFAALLYIVWINRPGLAEWEKDWDSQSVC